MASENQTQHLHVKGNIGVICLREPFDSALNKIKIMKYKPISLQDEASIRINEGIDSFMCQNNHRVSEAFVYMPDKKVYLSKYSPILEKPKDATDCHRKGIEFYLENGMLEYALRNSVEIKSKDIPTKEFDSYEETKFAFGPIARDYGLFLSENGVSHMPIWLCDCEQGNNAKPFARQAEIRSLKNHSALNSMNLNSTAITLGLKFKISA